VPIVVSPGLTESREIFFKGVFGPTQGYVCIARLKRDSKEFKEDFYMYPSQLHDMAQDIDKYFAEYEMYFCPQLLSGQKRKKEYVKIATCAWADLDSCSPAHMLVAPTITIQSSPGRYQAYWAFEQPLEPDIAEDISRRIAYKHSEQGADRSGWDLTQLLRVPLTYNHKYTGQDRPAITVIDFNRARYRREDFNMYPGVETFKYLDIPMPTEWPDIDADGLFEAYRRQLPITAWHLFQEEPNSDWSSALWKLCMVCFEAGMDRSEVYIIARDSACNKYRRDGRSPEMLWHEVCRAFNRHEHNINIIVPETALVQIGDLLSEDEVRWVEDNPGFVEEYIEWAKGLGDAAPQYHQAGAFTILSTLLCGSVRLPTSFGTLIPNLWFMILADTTLTRKTTAMDIAMDLLGEVDNDAVLATDGSIEGLLGGLSTRPGRPSVFLRDEFSGLLEQITKRDYYAGMPELLTKMYDGKMQKRVLRKETIEVRSPRLIVFAGGIRSKIQNIVTLEQIASGFMPRFVFITAESDISRLRPIGPPTDRDIGNREVILDRMKELVAHYQTQTKITTAGQSIQTIAPREWNATMTPEAWERYNKLENSMLELGLASEKPEIMTPTMDRLSKSGLKAALLIAASRQREETIVVDTPDLIRAIYYLREWRKYVIEVMNNVGRSTSERQLDNVYRAIRKKNGASRSQLMQNYHLSAREADQIFLTLEQRGLIVRQKRGRLGELLMATTVQGGASG
jgi:hypothetical protein